MAPNLRQPARIGLFVQVYSAAELSAGLVVGSRPSGEIGFPSLKFSPSF
jgi:hypothetical protein